MCKVSVIVPVYNVEQYLSACVESVLQQTYPDFELLLVDDGSTDGSSLLCDELACSDERIRVFHKENGGQGSARNFGLEHAKGTYVLFLDSDDTIAPTLLEVTVAAATANHAQVVIFDLQGCSPDGTVQFATKQKLAQNQLISADSCKTLLLSDPSPCNKLFLHAFLREQDFAFPVDVWYEDLIAIINLDAAVRAAVYIGGEPLYKYLLRENSSLRNGDAEKTVTNRLRAIEMIFTHYREKGLAKTYAQELSWIATYHGFFLPAREILHFTNRPGPHLKRLKNALHSYTDTPKKNPYFSTLSKKEQWMFRVLYCGNPLLIAALRKLYGILK